MFHQISFPAKECGWNTQSLSNIRPTSMTTIIKVEKNGNLEIWRFSSWALTCMGWTASHSQFMWRKGSKTGLRNKI